MTKVLATLAVCLSLTACVYKIDIVQGNYIDRDDLRQVEVGMDERQVSYLLGDPVARDTFNGRRWTYVYYFKTGEQQPEEAFRREVVIHFDDEGMVSQIVGNEYLFEEEAEDAAAAAATEAES